MAAPAGAPTLVSEIVVLSTALSAVALSIYVRTLCPSVPGGDSGEMVQVAIELGVAHPPGYPTWTLLAHVFSRLPWGEPAWRINLMSAVADAAASGLLSGAVGLWAGCAWTGLLAGGAFAFAPLVWLYAVQAEVFALNNAISALLLLLLVRFERSRSLGAACAGACAIGLAMTNQHTLVFFCVPYAMWALVLGRRTLLAPRALLCLARSGLLGLSPYLYCVVQGGPDAAWGSWGAQRSVGGLLTHMLRREYGTFRLANTDSTTDSDFWPRLTAYLTAVPAELPPYAAPPLGLGLVRSLACARLRPLGGVLAAAYLLYVTVFMYLSNLPAGSAFYLQIQQRFWPQPNMLTCAWFALGTQRAARALAPHTRAPLAVAALVLVGWHAHLGFEVSEPCNPVPPGCNPVPHGLQPGAARLQPQRLQAATLCLQAAAPCTQAGDQSRNDIFRQYGVQILEALPDKPNVLLLTHGDEVCLLCYAHSAVPTLLCPLCCAHSAMLWQWRYSLQPYLPYLPRLCVPTGAQRGAVRAPRAGGAAKRDRPRPELYAVRMVRHARQAAAVLRGAQLPRRRLRHAARRRLRDA
jgi:hypothetical protein